MQGQVITQLDSTSAQPTHQKSTSNAAWTVEQTNITGLRNPSSENNSYLPVRVLVQPPVIISVTTAVAIGGSSAANDRALFRVSAHTALTGTCVIAGFADEAGGAKSYTLPAGFVGERNFEGAPNSAGALTVTCSNAADDDKVIVIYGVV